MPASAMGCHADLLAHGEHRTGRAAGESAGADVLAERDEEAVDLNPVALRELRLERGHRLLRSPRLDVAPAVGDAVDVDIDADAELAAGDTEHQVGALGADAVEREQNVVVARQRAAVLGHHAAADLVDLPGFALAVHSGADRCFDLAGCEPADFSRGAGEREQPPRGWEGDLVPGADGDDAAD